MRGQLVREVQAGGEFRIEGASPRASAGDKGVAFGGISAIGNKGDLMFMTFDGSMNVDIFKQFILQTIKEVGGPVTMIVDNLKVHHANCLADWLKERKVKDSFSLEYLPSYSPELNPDEYLNRDAKAGLAERALPADSKAVSAAVVEHLEGRKRTSEKFFKAAIEDDVPNNGEEP